MELLSKRMIKRENISRPKDLFRGKVKLKVSRKITFPIFTRAKIAELLFEKGITSNINESKEMADQIIERGKKGFANVPKMKGVSERRGINEFDGMRLVEYVDAKGRKGYRLQPEYAQRILP